MKYYAGIGSRSAPAEVCAKLTLIASELEVLSYVLRSGGASGADKAFEHGVCLPYNKTILRPKHSTKEAELVASKIHPMWSACNEYARQLHGRNVQLILGENLLDPVDFVIAWTLDGANKGGTRTGLVLAAERGIPCFNLALQEDETKLKAFMQSLK